MPAPGPAQTRWGHAPHISQYDFVTQKVAIRFAGKGPLMPTDPVWVSSCGSMQAVGSLLQVARPHSRAPGVFMVTLPGVACPYNTAEVHTWCCGGQDTEELASGHFNAEMNFHAYMMRSVVHVAGGGGRGAETGAGWAISKGAALRTSTSHPESQRRQEQLTA